MPTDISLDDRLQDLAEETGQRLVLLDAALRVVGYSIHESDADRARLGHILAHSDSWPRPAIPVQGYAPADLPLLGRAQFLGVTDAGRMLGYLLMAGDDTATDPPNEALRAATGELGGLLGLREARRETRRARAAELLGVLLGPDAPARAEAAAALIEEGLIGSSHQYSAVALGQDPATLAAETDNTRGVALTVDFLARSSTASVAGGAVDGIGVLIFPRPVVAERLDRLLKGPEGGLVRAGIGPLVGSLAEAIESYDRARAAWRAACLGTDRQPRVLRWSDAGIDGLVAMLPLETLGVSDLPAPLRRLWETGPDPVLVETLSCYLSSGGDARATARRLGIHRSTFYYRLDRLRAVLAVDLSEGAVRRELDTGLRVARFARL